MAFSKPGSTRVAFYEIEDADTVLALKRRTELIRPFLSSAELSECRTFYPASGDMIFALDVDNAKLSVSLETAAVSGPDTECVRKALTAFVETAIPLDLVGLREWSIVLVRPTARPEPPGSKQTAP